VYIIDTDNKTATAIVKKSFSELGLKERSDLQEWIVNEPEILGERLLIIQKEFDGFSETKERLDLLALDTSGNIVIIENKLDDSGKDVVWQALKYVSYCAILKKSEIVEIYQKYLGANENAEEKLSEFFKEDFENIKLNPQDGDQRLILVAANFRKEVTSTVLWLRDHGVDIKCVRVTPYKDDKRILLDAVQILPVPEVADYQIQLSAKKQEDVQVSKGEADRYVLRRRFWEKALSVFKETLPPFKNISPTKDNYITASIGHKGILLGAVVRLEDYQAEIYIDTGDKIKNKNVFCALKTQKEALELACKIKFDWQDLPTKRACRICVKNDELGGLYDEDSWQDGVTWLSETLKKMYDVFITPIERVMK
jgi:hypothetical protein